MKQKVYTKPMMEEVEVKAFAFCNADSQTCPGEYQIGEGPGLPEEDDNNIFKGRTGGTNLWED